MRRLAEELMTRSTCETKPSRMIQIGKPPSTVHLQTLISCKSKVRACVSQEKKERHLEDGELVKVEENSEEVAEHKGQHDHHQNHLGKFF